MVADAGNRRSTCGGVGELLRANLPVQTLSSSNTIDIGLLEYLYFFLQFDLVYLSSAGKPTFITLCRSRADCIELVEECRYKATGTTDILFRSSIFCSNLVHQDTRKHSEKSVRAVGSQEAARNCSDGATSLRMRLDRS